MIKVKDGYAKLIGTTYAGSASRVLLSNGGDHVLGNASDNIPLNNGTVNTNLNADMLDGYHVSANTGKTWGTIPAISTLGYMDVGKDIEFHYDNTTNSDYSTALMCTGNYGNIVRLPSTSGTLALTSDLTWGNIANKPSSFTPASHTHSYITLGGDLDVSALSKGSNSKYQANAVTANTVYSDSFPTLYGNTLTLNGSGAGLFFISWSGTYTDTDTLEVLDTYSTELYLRNRRDNQTVWTGWTRVLTDKNYSSILDSRYYTETEVNNKLAGYLPLSGGLMNSTAYISWNNGSDGNDVSDWNITTNGLRIISSAATTTKAPTQYSTGLHVKGRYGFLLASQGGSTSNEFFIKNVHNTIWNTLIHSNNYTNYTVKKDGTGASGTWNISISGNSATSAKLNMTSITSYDGLTPVGVYGYTNTNGDNASNGYPHSNTSTAIVWGKDNCKVILAARAGRNSSEVYIRQYYTDWGSWFKLLHSGNTYISSDTITINGASITPLTAHQSLANCYLIKGAMGSSSTAWDWNSYTTLGSYKVLTGTTINNHPKHNGSADAYPYGIAYVIRGQSSDSENRTVQMYFPHGWTNYSNIPLYLRMFNGSGWTLWARIPSVEYINTTNFPGLNKTGTVTSVTVTGANGLSGTGTITTSGTITLSNAGVRSTTINGNYLRVNTNGTNADLTIPYASNAATATTANRLALNGITNDTTYGTYAGIIQNASNGPESTSWHNSIKILHNNSAGYYTQLAQNFTGSHGLWHRSNRAGTISRWYKVIDDLGGTIYGDLSLQSDEGNSPKLRFIRGGSVGDSSALWDWLMYISSGHFYLQADLGNGSWTTELFINTSHSVGIGTTSPSHKLHVNGNIFLNNLLYFADSAASVIKYGQHTATALGSYPLPSLGSNGLGLYVRPSKSTDEGGIIITEDTCMIFNSADSNWSFQVHNTDLSQKDFSGTNGDGTKSRVFGIADSGSYAWSRGGFLKNGSSDSYVLLGGGGHKALSDFSMSHSHPYLPLAGGTLSSSTAQISRSGSSTSWIYGRTNAMVRINSYSGYNAIASMKTTDGDWSLGVYSNNTLYFTYVTDTNFNANTNATTALVSINASGNLYAAHFYESSDINLKTNIEAITTSDNTPLLKSFDWKDSGEHSYGLIAQELEEQGYSELVSVKDDGYKTVNYSAALSLIVGKLQVKIKELEKEIENLKNKN